MRIGVISDPHGCWVGLEATLDWLEEAGVDRIVCAGDIASFGPQPNECISLLAERDVDSIQGNSDRDILLPPSVDQYADERTRQLTAVEDWCRERLSANSRHWLAALPLRLTPSPGLLIVHGGLEAMDEIVDGKTEPVLPHGVSVVVAGHLHVPFTIRTKQGVWMNAGSAGRPCDGDPRAACVILEEKPREWKASIHRIPFDLEEAVRAIRESTIPYVERMIETQRNACWW